MAEERTLERGSVLERRGSGVLTHITSLLGPYGTGDLGAEARRYVDWLAACRQTWWEVLPLSPIGKGNCPYASVSAFASEPMLISLEGLVEAGWLKSSELPKPLKPTKSKSAKSAISGVVHADFDASRAIREKALRTAYGRFRKSPISREFTRFVERESHWLADYALFQALSRDLGKSSWTKWPKGLRDRDPEAMEDARERLADEIGFELFAQYVVERQWHDLRDYAADRGVRIMGDLPIFVSLDSADVWANREIFWTRRDGKPEFVAGVPPDYFNKDGQLWGSALYRWDVLKKSGYTWWIDRFRRSIELFDAVRIDHFIGFCRYWEIPGDAVNARKGRWVAVPGDSFFTALAKALGPLPLLAEDLGAVSEEVFALRDKHGFPGMRVIQFAFGDDEGATHHRPHAYPPNSVAYTGTHDHDTTVGWWNDLNRRAAKGKAPHDIAFLKEYLATDGEEPHWDVIRGVWASAANIAIAPMQDVLGLDGAHRMNVPGVPNGNWEWRLPEGWDDPVPAGRLARLTRVYGR